MRLPRKKISDDVAHDMPADLKRILNVLARAMRILLIAEALMLAACSPQRETPPLTAAECRVDADCKGGTNMYCDVSSGIKTGICRSQPPAKQ